MANLVPQSFLRDLISTGKDAQSNLFTATFSVGNAEASSKLEGSLKNFQVRLLNFTIPEIGASTISVPYQNSSVDIITPSSILENNLNLKFRLDGNLSLYNILVGCLNSQSEGLYISDGVDYSEVRWTIDVMLYSPQSSDEYNAIKAWKFTDCRVVSVKSLDLAYAVSNPLTVEASFIYKQMTIRDVEQPSGSSGVNYMVSR